MDKSMNKFFLMTRGRTGSTAIVDELNKIKGVCATQELFLKFDYKKLVNQFKNLMEHYQAMLPFELWKTQKAERVKEAWFGFLQERFLTDKRLVDVYLAEMEKSPMCRDAGAFGFKVLSHHFDETPPLKDALLKRGYGAIYLKRNIPRQVISGMIAKQRGIYNTKQDFRDDGRYQIDIEEFRSLVNWETQAVENDLAFLREAGFQFIEVTYEEFMGDKQGFFDRVLGFLGMPPEVPQASCYSVMIKDLEHTVENYQAVAECVAAMGMHIE